MKDDALQALDQSFEAIWQKPEKIHSAVKAWQDQLTQLTQLIAESNLTQQQSEELQRMMNKWRRDLEENKKLLTFHLEHLQNERDREKTASSQHHHRHRKFTRQ